MNWQEVMDKLESGQLRSAEKIDGVWRANKAVKEGILEAFKAGEMIEYHGFADKHNVLPQKFTPERKIRVAPGGTTVRKGAYIAPGVVIMNPAFVNVGAYVDEGTMVDSHALVGSCAQIGKRVHLSAAVQIGGVLEPVGQAPVIIEDDAFIGAGAVIVEGVQVLSQAVIAPGVVLSKGVPVFDCVNNRQLDRGEPIPERAIVIPGTRPMSEKYPWAREQGLQMSCALIVKYRDEKSDASLELEGFLR